VARFGPVGWQDHTGRVARVDPGASWCVGLGPVALKEADSARPAPVRGRSGGVRAGQRPHRRPRGAAGGRDKSPPAWPGCARAVICGLAKVAKQLEMRGDRRQAGDGAGSGVECVRRVAHATDDGMPLLFSVARAFAHANHLTYPITMSVMKTVHAPAPANCHHKSSHHTALARFSSRCRSSFLCSHCTLTYLRARSSKRFMNACLLNSPFIVHTPFNVSHLQSTTPHIG